MKKLLIALLAFSALFACLSLDLVAGGIVVWRMGRPPARVEVHPTLTHTLPPVSSPTRPRPTATPAAIPRMGPTPITTPTATPSTLEQVLNTPMPERDLYGLAERLRKLSAPVPRVLSRVPKIYALGDQETFWVSDQQAKRYYTVTAELRYETLHLYMWVQDGLDINQDDLAASAEKFEQDIYPVLREYFGEEWSPGVDGDPHLHILNALIPGVGGYYSSADQYSREIDPYSNQREMFYINVGAFRPGTASYNSVLAHEFQHMIHWYHDHDEETWVNEGLSELAADLVGYDGNRSAGVFALNPDVQLTAWAKDVEASGPHYGSAYLFNAYLAQRLGTDAIRQLVAAPEDGIAGYEVVLRQYAPDLTFKDLFRDWLVANYLDRPALGDGRYGYTDLDVRVTPARTIQRFPARGRDTVHQYGADYIELQPDPDSPSLDLSITFTGTATVPLVATTPRSGGYFWWSNRGDGGDSTLTRAFDLTGLTSATLEFWTWYDIEEDWDYAYVEVSTDEGRTWETLPGRFTTTTNPNGNNFGHAWTGRSGEGGEGPEWVKEVVDLTPYAGRPILLRFEYITDDAYNAPGFVMDDISIPELGYHHDAESGDDGWRAHGFLRTDNILPQEWLVQLIEKGDTTRVRRMVVTEDSRGGLTLTGLGREVEKAVLIISPIAPRTTELASYEFLIRPVEGK